MINGFANSVGKVIEKLVASRKPCSVLMMFGMALLTGCGSLPKPETAWSVRRPVDTDHTTWARTLAPGIAEHPGLSGVQLLQYGRDAFAARLALADATERCLDVQYYMWKPDDSGRLLLEKLVQAANRGVRVRLLLDDMGGSASDDDLLALSQHTNIEVRLFNPVASRSFRYLSIAFDFRRITRRMHNKSFTADKLVTILGGRNVEDRYFAVGDEASQFADFDVLAAGPVAGEVAGMFDRYWYSDSSIPIQALNRKHLSPEQLAQSFSRLTRQAAAISEEPVFKDLAQNGVGNGVRHHMPNLVWGPIQLVYDQPEKITTDPDDFSTHLLPQLHEVVAETTNELFIICPYFIPGKEGVDLFRSLRARGIRVVILSNSLASNDSVPMHVGYRRYRKDLLLAGVELWELKPDVQLRVTAGKDHSSTKPKGKKPGSSLHAKSFVFDQRELFVGSLNLDPHSAWLNTEMGLIIDIPKLATQVKDDLESRLPEYAYRLEFVPGPGPCKTLGSIVWISQKNGKEVRYTSEPHASFSRRIMVFLLSFLPIESQL